MQKPLLQPDADPVDFRPVRSARLSEEIINQIARLVDQGHIRLNQRFPSERDLQDRWQVSRPVLREAFRVLEMRGVIESRPGGGRFLRSTRVLDPSWPRADLAARRDVLLHLWDARETVECRIAELAALNATAEQLADIARPLEIVGALGHEELAARDLNGEFHSAIARAAGNPVLEEMAETLVQKNRQVGFKHLVGVANWAALQGEHRPIYEAIRARDPAAARAAMARHFDNLRARIRPA